MESMLSDDEFQGTVREAVTGLPKAFGEKLENVTFIIHDLADRETCLKLKITDPYSLFGLYEGVPKVQRGSGYQMVLPDRITLYKIPHLLVSADLQELKDRIRTTVLHEIGHHFGLSENDLSGT